LDTKCPFYLWQLNEPIKCLIWNIFRFRLRRLTHCVYTHMCCVFETQTQFWNAKYLLNIFRDGGLSIYIQKKCSGVNQAAGFFKTFHWNKCDYLQSVTSRVVNNCKHLGQAAFLQKPPFLNKYLGARFTKQTYSNFYSKFLLKQSYNVF